MRNALPGPATRFGNISYIENALSFCLMKSSDVVILYFLPVSIGGHFRLRSLFFYQRLVQMVAAFFLTLQLQQLHLSQQS